MYVTYAIFASNVPLLLCWHQLPSLWATSQYRCDHLLQLLWAAWPSKCWKEKQWKSTLLYKAHFSSVMTNLWSYGWVCFRDDYTLQKFFKHRVRSSITFYNSSAYHINSFSWLKGAQRVKQHNDLPHYWHGFGLCKVPSCLNTSFRPLKMVLSSSPIEIRFLELTNLNENYIHWIILVSEIVGI